MDEKIVLKKAGSKNPAIICKNALEIGFNF